MFAELADAAPLFLHGAGVTVLYTVLGALAALVVSFVFGLMALSRWMLVRGVSRTIVEFFRGTSLVIQLLWIFFVLPQLGLRFEPMAAATIAFGLNFGAYGSEVVRGAIASVPKTQWEASVALSLGRFRRMRRVIMPQALPEMIPPFGNLWIQILKSSSLLYLIGITELTFEVKQLQFDVGSMAAFSIALVVYFLLAQVLVAMIRWVEARAAARVGRGPKAVVIEQPQAVTPA
ncbi:ectoine/hydroxyectoine ABC transporter permease subunit EhuC [Mycolicibacterium pyrenivorans]|uniref:ectoine/hydroxyectoine ABC transporter permease subunit EhuC n=1 Tax=Mycolicibacterium pyrenivorans TaxID=187102 RepID=UPI0021F38750|nr:ectoine/hydroxyectoine ABC transporter permease subunit EhuC [Mycolicibacterium pyrenivorans]MCV7152657.1 ectoine/hydroxyectoine ABC transporter permease subunit EhuC [Mycolicibacterium pyrenivorans]